MSVRVGESVRRGVVVLLVVALGPACATETAGERGRRSNAPAELITTSAQAASGYSTKIITLDGEPVSGGGFMLLPGRHTVEVEGKCAPRNNVAGAALFGVAGVVAASIVAERNAQYSDLLKACFIVRPELTYEVRTFAEGGVWQVQVIDQTTTYDVKSPCKEEAKLVAGPARRGPQPVDPFDK